MAICPTCEVKAIISTPNLFSANFAIAPATTRDAVSRAEVQYQDGVITNLDLIDTETTLAEAKLLYLQVIYKNVINKYALDKVVGSIVW